MWGGGLSGAEVRTRAPADGRWHGRWHNHPQAAVPQIPLPPSCARSRPPTKRSLLPARPAPPVTRQIRDSDEVMPLRFSGVTELRSGTDGAQTGALLPTSPEVQWAGVPFSS